MSLPSFASLLERCPAVPDDLPVPADAATLCARSDDRYLSQMSLRAFRAGLRHALVDARWPAFEDAFHAFDPHRVRAMSDEDLEALMGDRRLIRHWGKIKAVRDNAAALIEVSEAHGGFGAFLAHWPGDDVIGLWRELGRRFKQMGGNSAPVFLRMVGKDTFILTDDVVRTLIAAGVLTRKPTTAGERAAAQQAFNAWAAESGRPLCQISRILALVAP